MMADNGTEPTHLVIIHAYVTFGQSERIRDALRQLGVTDGVMVEKYLSDDESSRLMIDSVRERRDA